jgi:hypothetical protein
MLKLNPYLLHSNTFLGLPIVVETPPSLLFPTFFDLSSLFGSLLWALCFHAEFTGLERLICGGKALFRITMRDLKAANLPAATTVAPTAGRMKIA